MIAPRVVTSATRHVNDCTGLGLKDAHGALILSRVSPSWTHSSIHPIVILHPISSVNSALNAGLAGTTTYWLLSVSAKFSWSPNKCFLYHGSVFILL